MTGYMTPARFAGKVEWEGGVFEALDYGLEHTRLDPDDSAAAELRAAWAELERLYAPVAAQAALVGRLLDQLADEVPG